MIQPSSGVWILYEVIRNNSFLTNYTWSVTDLQDLTVQLIYISYTIFLITCLKVSVASQTHKQTKKQSKRSRIGDT